MVVMAFKIAGSRAARQPHVIYHFNSCTEAVLTWKDMGEWVLERLREQRL